MDVLATNHLARALYAPVLTAAGDPANLARFQFLDVAHAEAFYRDLDDVADDTVATLHAAAGRDPHDRDLQELVGELSTRSEDFRRRWAAHDVRQHSSGAKAFHHPVVGDMTLQYEVAELAARPGLTLVIYTAEPGSTSEANLRLLSSWAAGDVPASPARSDGIGRSL
jgi:hypothetical protein